MNRKIDQIENYYNLKDSEKKKILIVIVEIFNKIDHAC